MALEAAAEAASQTRGGAQCGPAIPSHGWSVASVSCPKPKGLTRRLCHQSPELSHCMTQRTGRRPKRGLFRVMHLLFLQREVEVIAVLFDVERLVGEHLGGDRIEEHGGAVFVQHL